MKKTLLVGSLGLIVSLGSLLAGCGPGQEAQAGPQKTCPMMGTPIDKKVFVDYKGKRVYFCCKDCVPKFKANPKKQIKNMTEQGVVLEDTPKD